jgi:hypothetical protein
MNKQVALKTTLFSGPRLYTLCTVLVDLDEATMTIYKGNPRDGNAAHVLRIRADPPAG